MTRQPLEVLHSVFGYQAFRPPQDEIIRELVDGRDAVVIMPTGGGKSLCYQIPAMVRDGVGIVVSPLIALMQDQVNALRQSGVAAACLNSTQTPEQSAQVERDLLAGAIDLLYVAPERLVTSGFLQLLHRLRPALFAIDEAHCVSQWGHDFRKEYTRLSILHERFPQVPRIALTATADDATRREIILRLALDSARLFMCGFDRPNIRYHVHQGQSAARDALLQFIRTEHPADAGIVYCLSRRKVEQTARWLDSQGFTALPYHAGLSHATRELHQRRFLQEDGVIIVATIAFGMGIDKPDVRFVAHMNLPRSLEAYYQETGRAGRDGMPANAWMTYGLQDVITLRQMLESSDAADSHKRTERYRLDAMLGFAEVTDCRRQALLAYFDDPSDTPCGNCDNCLQPVETRDATEQARKALSCVYRTGQRFGVNYLIDVLTGKDSQRIRSFSHDRLAVYGIGKELNARQWRDLFRQLISRDLLGVDLEGHGALKLTPACRPLLRGEDTLHVRKDSRPDKTRARRDRKMETLHRADQPLWDALRQRRRQLADAQGVPPYIVFHDATLMEMVALRPRTLDSLAAISGIGSRKLESYGEQFLQVLRDYPPAAEPQATDS